MSIEVERLKTNLEAIVELQESPPEHKEPVLFEYVLPMLRELLEAQLVEMEDDFDEDPEEGAQVIELNVSTYTELQGFLRLAFSDPSLSREYRRPALDLYATIRSEVDGKPIEEIMQLLTLPPEPQTPSERTSAELSPEEDPKPPSIPLDESAKES